VQSHISCCFLNLYSHSELGLCDTKRSDQVIFGLKGRNGLYCPCFLPRKEPNVQLSIKKRLLRFGISQNLTTGNSFGSYVYKKNQWLRLQSKIDFRNTRFAQPCHGFIDLTVCYQNTNHGSTKFASY